VRKKSFSLSLSLFFVNNERQKITTFSKGKGLKFSLQRGI